MVQRNRRLTRLRAPAPPTPRPASASLPAPGARRGGSIGIWPVFPATNGLIYVSGGSDPRETHVWRFPLAGGSGAALTTAPGQHSASFSEDATTLAHT